MSRICWFFFFLNNKIKLWQGCKKDIKKRQFFIMNEKVECCIQFYA